jgi:hypothetical protein
MAAHQKLCESCGEEYTARRKDAKYCSVKCRYDQFYKNHPENGKDRYARVKANPERWAAEQETQREKYLANRERYLERAHIAWEEQRVAEGRQPRQRKYTHPLSYRHGCDYQELFIELWETQDGRCYLCDDPLDREGARRVNIDHDHRCCPKGKTCEYCRRGLACAPCNVLIGRANDDPERLHRIADNLAKANADVEQRQKAKMTVPSVTC